MPAAVARVLVEQGWEQQPEDEVRVDVLHFLDRLPQPAPGLLKVLKAGVSPRKSGGRKRQLEYAAQTQVGKLRELDKPGERSLHRKGLGGVPCGTS